MQTKEQIEIEFKKELAELLTKYKADIYVEEINVRGYIPGTWVNMVYTESEYDKDGNCIKESADFKL
jgi:hypothetical protein